MAERENDRRKRRTALAVALTLLAGACAGGGSEEPASPADSTVAPEPVAADGADDEPAATDEQTDAETGADATAEASADETDGAGADAPEAPPDSIFPADWDPTGEDFERIYDQLSDAYSVALEFLITDGLDQVVAESSEPYDRVLDQIWADGSATWDYSERDTTILSVDVYARPGDDRVILLVEDSIVGTTRIIDDETGEVIDEWTADNPGRLALVALERNADGAWRFLELQRYGSVDGLRLREIPDADQMSIVESGTVEGLAYRVGTWTADNGNVCVAMLITDVDASGVCVTADEVEILQGTDTSSLTWHREVPGTDLDVRFVIAGPSVRNAQVSSFIHSGQIPLHDSGTVQVGALLGRTGGSRTLLGATIGSVVQDALGSFAIPCNEWIEYGPHPFVTTTGYLLYDDGVDGPTDELFGQVLEDFDEFYRFGETTAEEIALTELPEGLLIDDYRGVTTRAFVFERQSPDREYDTERWLLQLEPRTSLTTLHVVGWHRYREC